MHDHADGHDHDHDHDHDADDATAILDPKAVVKEVGPCRWHLAIEIAADKVRERLDEKMNDVAEDAALPGFRRGKVPRAILQRKFGASIAEEVRIGLMSRAFQEVTEKHKLEPLGEPQIDPEKVRHGDGQPLAFEVVLETRPQVELKNYLGLPAKRPKIEATERDLEAALKGMQDARAELAPVEDGVAKKGDFVTADTEVLVGGVPVDRAENATFALEDTLSLFQKPAPEVLRALVGSKTGADLRIEIILPDDHSRKEAAGKPATLKLLVKGVRRRTVPTIDAAWAKTMDFDSLDEMKAEVRKRLQAEKEKEADRIVEDQLVDALVAAADFPLPEGLVQSGLQDVLRRQHMELSMRGAKPEEIEKHLETVRGASREEIVKQLKSLFLLDAIGQKERIYVTETEIDERIAAMAPAYGKWPHEMKAHLEQNDLVGSLRRQVRAEKIRSWLRSKADVKPA